MQPNIQVKLPSKLVNLFIGKRKKKETSAKRISFPLGTFNPPLPEYAWTELITRFPTKKKKSFDKFFFFRPKKK